MTAEIKEKRFVVDERDDDPRTAEGPRSEGELSEPERRGPSEKATGLRPIKKAERPDPEIPFNKAVQRFRHEIMTKRLEAACFDTEGDYPIIFEGMKRTSHFSGRDLVEGLPQELPSLKEIDNDIDSLSSFASEARGRKKKLEKSMDSYEGDVAPILL